MQHATVLVILPLGPSLLIASLLTFASAQNAVLKFPVNRIAAGATGKMAQWERALAALVEDLGSIPSTSQKLVTPMPGDPIAPLSSMGTRNMYIYM